MADVRRDPKSFEDPVDLNMAIGNSDAYKIRLQLSELVVSYYTFDKNYEELSNFLSLLQHPENQDLVWNMWRRNERTMATRELIRLLHNFVASVMSLVEHTRHIVKRLYANTSFWEEYDLQVKDRFLENELHQFMQELRNYSLHYRIPLTAARVHLENVTPDVAYYLERSMLLSGSFNWKKARPFIEKSSEEILLKEVVDSYHLSAKEFRLWLEKRWSEIHAEEFAWLDEMHARLKQLTGRS